MPTIRIDARQIRDRASFHAVFAAALGFPSFYGRNMDAWIDCLSDLPDPGTGMIAVHVRPPEVLTLHIDHARDFKTRLPDLFADLVECSAFVNARFVDEGRPAVLALSFCG